MNALFFVPLVLFFAAYYQYDIYVATAVLMVTTIVESIIHYVKHKNLDKNRQFTLVTIIILGSATLILQNADFIKWKPTVIYWALAIAFGFTHIFMQKTLAERFLAKLFKQALESEDDLPREIWRPVNAAWFVFTATLGFLNIYIAYQFSEATWVNFKVFGITTLTFAFTILQGLYVFKAAKPETKES